MAVNGSEEGCLIAGFLIGAFLTLLLLGVVVKRVIIPNTYRVAQFNALNGEWKYQIIDDQVWEIQE